jgi:hypothetical protein
MILWRNPETEVHLISSSLFSASSLSAGDLPFLQHGNKAVARIAGNTNYKEAEAGLFPESTE